MRTMNERDEQHLKRPDPWAPWRDDIESLAASCTDYLGRITRSLARGTDAHYVTEKAHLLRNTAGDLVDACHEATADAGRCHAEVEIEHSTGEEVWIDECSLPRGHTGPHSARRPATPIERAAEKAHELAEQARKVSDYLAWLTRPGACDIEDVDDVERELGTLGWRLAETRTAVAALRPGEAEGGAR